MFRLPNPWGFVAVYATSTRAKGLSEDVYYARMTPNATSPKSTDPYLLLDELLIGNSRFKLRLLDKARPLFYPFSIFVERYTDAHLAKLPMMHLFSLKPLVWLIYLLAFF